MSVPAGVMDSKDDLFGCHNGVYNFRTGEFRQHRKSDYLATRSDVTYDADARCDRWIQYVDEICCGDKEMINYIQRMVGYILTGDVSEQVWFFFSGNGSNGKSVFAEIIGKLLGGYAGKIQQCLYAGKTNGMEQLRATANLMGKRLVVGSELTKGVYYNDDKLKDITGGDKLTACRVYESQFEFDPTHKLIIYGNYKPSIRGSGDQGFWRRMVIFPFDAKFSSEKGNKDIHLVDTLKSELSGILNWAIEGHKMWLESDTDLTVLPQRMQQEKSKYMEDQDTTGRFLKESFDRSATLPRSQSATIGFVYETYKDWCVDEGIHCQTRKNLEEELERAGFEVASVSGYKRLIGFTAKTLVEINEVANDFMDSFAS